MSGIEIVGIAASVLQLADVGARLSVKLFTFSRKVRDAKASIAQLSQEIASTGAALRELGVILEDDGVADLGSKNAVATTNQLLADCWRVFQDIGDTMGDKKLMSGGSGNRPSSQVKIDLQPSFSFRRRLKFPFIEPEIQLLKSKLEGLKSSLVLMLQILSVASHIKSRPKAVVPEDQQALIQTLLAERQTHDEQFTQLMKRLEAATDDDPAETVVEGDVEANTSISAQSPLATPTLSSDGFSDATLASHASDQHEELPLRIRVRAQEIKDHALLAHNLVKEVELTRYGVNHGIRHNMQHAILRTHYQEWRKLARKYEPETLLALFSQYKAVARYWIDKHDDAGSGDDSGDDLDSVSYGGRGGPASSTGGGPPMNEKPEHIHFKDAIGRKVEIPWETGHRWKNMKPLITKMFAYIDGLGTCVADERYDLIGPEGSIILPDLWEAIVEPGMTITMMLWPLPEPSAEAEPPPLPSEDQKQSSPKKKTKLDSVSMPWMAGGAAKKTSRSRRTKGSKQKALSNLLLDWTMLGTEEVDEAVGLASHPPRESVGEGDETQQAPEGEELIHEEDTSTPAAQVGDDARDLKDSAEKEDNIVSDAPNENDADAEESEAKEDGQTEVVTEEARSVAGDDLLEETPTSMIKDGIDEIPTEDQDMPEKKEEASEPVQEQTRTQAETETSEGPGVVGVEAAVSDTQVVQEAEQTQGAAEAPKGDIEEAKATPETSEVEDTQDVEQIRDVGAPLTGGVAEVKQESEAIEKSSDVEAVAVDGSAELEKGSDVKEDRIEEVGVEVDREDEAQGEHDDEHAEEEEQAEVATSPLTMQPTAETKASEVEDENKEEESGKGDQSDAIQRVSSIREEDPDGEADGRTEEVEDGHKLNEEVSNKQDEAEKEVKDDQDDDNKVEGENVSDKSEDEVEIPDMKQIEAEDKEEVDRVAGETVAPISRLSDHSEDEDANGDEIHEAKAEAEKQLSEASRPPENPVSHNLTENEEEIGKQEDDDLGADGDDEDEDEEESAGETTKKDAELHAVSDTESDASDTVNVEPATKINESLSAIKTKQEAPPIIEPSSDDDDDDEEDKDETEAEEVETKANMDARLADDVVDTRTATENASKRPETKAKTRPQETPEPSSDEEEDEDEDDDDDDTDDDDDDEDEDEDESSDSDDVKIDAKKVVEETKTSPQNNRLARPGVNVATKKALFEQRR